MLQVLLLMFPRRALAATPTLQQRVVHAAIMHHVHVGDAESIHELLSSTPLHDSCLDCLGEGGLSALHVASGFGKLDVVHKLLDFGAQPMVLTTESLSALHMAATHCNSPASIGRLHAAGCPVDAQDSHGFSALHMAAHQGHYECVAELLRAGARTDLIVLGSSQNDARALAASRGHTAVERVFAVLVDGDAPTPADAALLPLWALRPDVRIPARGGAGSDSVDGVHGQSHSDLCCGVGFVTLMLVVGSYAVLRGKRAWTARYQLTWRRKHHRGGFVLSFSARDRWAFGRFSAFCERAREEPPTVDSGSSADGECAVCLNSGLTHVLVPCGHMCVCAACSERLMSEMSPRCPLCRTPCEVSQRVYLSGGWRQAQSNG